MTCADEVGERDLARRMIVIAAVVAALLAASALPALGEETDGGAGSGWTGFILNPERGRAAELARALESLGLRSGKRLPHDLLLVDAPPQLGAAWLESLPWVDWAEPDMAFSAAASPNDPDYPKQWNLERIGMPAAWDAAGGGKQSVVVAVVDSGVAYRDGGGFTRAPDFANTSFVPGYDFFDDDPDADDEYGHGTHVAAIIASSYGNSWRGAGIAYGCSIMPVRVLGVDGVGTASMVASGIYHAVDNGADVICLSLASPRHSKAVADAVRYAYERGVLCVAAAGNEGSDPGYPGGMDCPADEGKHVLAVGAVDYRKERAHYSN